MRRRLLVVAAGVLAALVLLEIGLRITGGVFLWLQEQRNQEAMEERGAALVLCVGESTTALGGEDSYPSQLEEVLNARSQGQRYAVLNKGIPGTDTSVIIDQLPHNLETYHPQFVVAMMGANDRGGAIPHHGRAAIERTGFPYNLKIFKLGDLLLHNAGKADRDRDAHGPGLHGKDHRGGGRSGPMVRLLSAYGRLCERHGLLEPAEDALLLVMELYGSASSYLDVARYYERLERHEEAARYFRGASKAAPDRPEGWYGLGRILRKEEQFEEAIRMFEKSIAVEPGFAIAHTSLGICYEELGRLDEAERVLVTAMELSPGGSREFIRLIDFYEKHGRSQEAMRFFERVLSEAPRPLLLGRIGRYFARTGRLDEAEEYFDRARALRRSSWPEMTERAFRRMVKLTQARGVRLIVVQYPTRSVEPLEQMLSGLPEILIVDNEALFNDVLAEEPYEALFWDNCYGDFGHCTRRGNRILAENIAEAILHAD